MSRISIIVAIAQNNAIGLENKLLYWLPNDLKRFKSLTTGHTIIMGRKTFESLPKGALPNRRNIVLTRQEITFPGAERYASLEEALKQCKEEEEVFIIGGASVYRESIQLADKLYITYIEDTPAQADAFFPKISLDIWKETGREAHSTDEKHLYPYQFVDYERIQ
ncbi:MAG: dihydrofolate reductase [Bacteroidaceae bacterium]|nr:dihydrofolate reductase [Bacteroidaceae bacterium]